MKKIFLFLLSLAIISGSTFARKHYRKSEHVIVTANVRVTGLDADEKPGLRWDDRKKACAEAIKREKPDIVCAQEVMYDSYQYLKEQLKGFAAFGFEGPEMDPYDSGYHFIAKNVIYYNTKKYELVGGGSYWLSDKPLKGGSLSWGAMRARHCNYVRLRDKKTNRQFRVLNVHLDHKSDPARQAEIKMVIDECDQYSYDFPQVMAGDFNSGVKNMPYRELTHAGWKDMWETIHGKKEFGVTAHAFKGKNYNKPNARRIDFIYYRGDVKPKSARVIDEKIDGIFPSDHYFLVAKFNIF